MDASGRDQMSDILVWAELRDGRPSGVAFELLNKATDLAPAQGGTVSAVVIGPGDCRACAAEFIAHGAGRVFVVEEPAAHAVPRPRRSRRSSAGSSPRPRPGVVLMGATSIGADLAPAVAARIGTGLTAHCTDLHMEDIDGRRQLVMVVPGWRGNLMVKIAPRKEARHGNGPPRRPGKGQPGSVANGRNRLHPCRHRRGELPRPDPREHPRAGGKAGWSKRRSSCRAVSVFTRQGASPCWRDSPAPSAA